MKVACLQNDLGRSLDASVASWRTGSQQRKYLFFSLNCQNNAQKHIGYRSPHGHPSIHYLCLFLYLSRNRNTPLSKQYSPDDYKDHKLESLHQWYWLKTKNIYEVLWKLNYIGYTEEWCTEMLTLWYNTTCTRKLHSWEKSIFCEDSWISTAQTLWKT